MMGRNHHKEKGLRSVTGLGFLRRWKRMEPGCERSQSNKHPACETDGKETRVNTMWMSWQTEEK